MRKINQDLECIVFRTNLEDKNAVDSISEALEAIDGITEWSVDLEDWEKVLRVVGTGICAEHILNALRAECVDIQEIPV